MAQKVTTVTVVTLFSYNPSRTHVIFIYMLYYIRTVRDES